MAVANDLRDSELLSLSVDGFGGIVETVQSRNGGNRSNDYCQIDADNDLGAVAEWLKAKAPGESKETNRRYTLEARRFIAWMSLNGNVALSEVKADHLRAYNEFLVDPDRSSIILMPRSMGGLGLLKGGLSARSASHSMTILRGMFNFLHKTGYLKGSPFSGFRKIKFMAKDLMGQIHESSKPIIDEKIIPQEWMKAIKEQLESESLEIGDHASWRRRWLFTLLWSTGLRRNEVAQVKKGSFTKLRSGWVLYVIGKGNKMRAIPVGDKTMAEFELYCGVLWNKKKVVLDDNMPAVYPDRIKKSEDGKICISSSQVYRIVEEILERGADRLRSEGKVSDAEEVLKMHPHSFRHFYATSLLDNGCDARVVQNILGHESLNTTMLYGHESEELLIQSVKKAMIDAF